MAYQTSWFVEKRVLLIRIEGSITVDQVRDMLDTLSAMVQSGDAPVHLVADINDMTEFPRDLAQLQRLTANMDQVGVEIVVGQVNPVVRFFASIISQLGKFELRFVSDMDTAVKTLKRVDLTLADWQPT